MKTIASYTGKVIKLASPPDLSTVLLKEDGKDNELETTAVTEKLLEQNLGEGDAFKITIYQSIDGKLIGEVEKV